jgi:alcohol sulfotransferase
MMPPMSSDTTPQVKTTVRDAAGPAIPGHVQPLGVVTRAAGTVREAAKKVRRAQRRLLLAAVARRADAILASYPKAGRTWLRYLLANYFNLAFALEVVVDFNTVFEIVPNRDLDRRRGLKAWRYWNRRDVPLVAVTHEAYSWTWRRPIIFVVRDPRDLMVSAFFHHTQHKHRFTGDVSTLIRDRSLGIDDLITYLNRFAGGLAGRRHVVVSYEELSTDPIAAATKVLGFLQVPVDKGLLERAVAASSFEAMREAELTSGIPGHDYDLADNDSLRVRRGKVGGFHDTLSEDDIAYIEGRCRDALSPEAKRLLAGTRFLS